MIGCSFFQMFFNIECMFFDSFYIKKGRGYAIFCIPSSIISCCFLDYQKYA
ncbi:unknown [Bacteroides sp. CAG:875]|nr:unknown [Bacteroides sp. CAG:875]